MRRTGQQEFAERFDDLEVHAARFVCAHNEEDARVNSQQEETMTAANFLSRTTVEQEAEVCDGLLVGGRVDDFAASDFVATAVQQAEVECRNP